MPDTIKQTSILQGRRIGELCKYRNRLADAVAIPVIVRTPCTWSRDKYWVRSRENPAQLILAHITELID